MRWSYVLLLLVLSPLLLSAETPGETESYFEGGFVMRRPLPAETTRPRMDRLTWTLLIADGGARALDAYSTQRMLRNSCGSGRQMAGVSTCNYEQNLPGFIANRASGIYSFDAVVWLSEVAATRMLVQHNHRHLARFIPLLDLASTTSFAVNNLTLSIGGRGSAVPVTASVRLNLQR
jgi:hypothetical protein